MPTSTMTCLLKRSFCIAAMGFDGIDQHEYEVLKKWEKEASVQSVKFPQKELKIRLSKSFAEFFA